MFSKRLLLVLIALFIFSCHRRNDVTIYDTHFEILNGEVKQLNEIYNNFNKIETHITSFDKRGNAIQMREIGGYCGNCLTNFTYKYDGAGKKAAVIMAAGGRQQSYQCDTNGRVAEEGFNTKDYDFDKNDWAKRREVFKYNKEGYLIESASYQDTTRFSWTTYKYNRQHLLIETDEFNGIGNILLIRVTYNYLALDAIDNWLRRIVTIEHELKEDGHMRQIVTKDTEIRKVIYY
ncbi:MAG TPA: hypothetical protein VK671_01225 [Mucilaginibacter sp.]|jgi:hypothetical protein|nr:hypothetical protein [Mucilaginibacter sp.]